MDSLSSLTVKELRILAGDLQIQGRSSWKVKDQLILGLNQWILNNPDQRNNVIIGIRNLRGEVINQGVHSVQSVQVNQGKFQTQVLNPLGRPPIQIVQQQPIQPQQLQQQQLQQQQLQQQQLQQQQLQRPIRIQPVQVQPIQQQPIRQVQPVQVQQQPIRQVQPVQVRPIQQQPIRQVQPIQQQPIRQVQPIQQQPIQQQPQSVQIQLKSSQKRTYTDLIKFHQQFGDADKFIAEGSFGRVYTTTKQNTVIKYINYYDFDIREPIILRHLEILVKNGTIPHPNIIDIEGIYLPSSRGNVVQGQHKMGSIRLAMPELSTTLRKKIKSSNSILDEKLRPIVFYQILRGVAFCHSKGVWHLDVKDDNVLYLEPNTKHSFPIVKLGDFGISRIYEQTRKDPNRIVTPGFRAPELLLNDKKYTEIADVWSVGVMLLESIVGRYMFYEGSPNPDDLIKLVFQHLGRPSYQEWPELPNLLSNWKGTDPFSKTLPNASLLNTLRTYGKSAVSTQEFNLLSLLLAWPNNRISALSALDHPYFNDARRILYPLYPAPIFNNNIPGNILGTPLEIDILPCGHLLSIDEQRYLPNFTGWSPFLKTREKLYDWIYKHKSVLKLSYHVIFYSYLLMDLFLEKVSKTRDLDYYGYVAAALTIASDIYSVEADTNLYADLEFLMQYSITQNKILEYRDEILTLFDFDLAMPTSGDFIVSYLEVPIPTSPKRNPNKKEVSPANLNHVYLLAVKLMMTPLVYSNKLKQSDIAKIAVTGARVSAENCVPMNRLTAVERSYFNPSPESTAIDSIILKLRLQR